jgi:hypothetical protein
MLENIFVALTWVCIISAFIIWILIKDGSDDV